MHDFINFLLPCLQAHGFRILHTACDQGKEDFVQLLIESGADVNVVAVGYSMRP
jgi:ankyrin repeat protein